MTHPSLERLESDSSKKSTSSKPLTCEASVKVLFRRQVYSNSSTGLEKSAQGVPHTHPSPIFGALLALLMASWEKKFLPWEKSFLEDGVNYSVTRGLKTG